MGPGEGGRDGRSGPAGGPRRGSADDRAVGRERSTGNQLTHRQNRVAPATISAVRGILSAAGYVPYRRLPRAQIAAFFGSGGGKGTRSVASHDEDTTTMGVEAARLALRSVPGATPDALWFATATPAYLDKTNATAIHAALRLPGEVPAYDFGGALRSGTGALSAALGGIRPGPWWCRPTCETGCRPSPTSRPVATPAAALVVGDDSHGAPVVAEHLGRRLGHRRVHSTDGARPESGARGCGRSVSARPATSRSAREAWARALKACGLEATDRSTGWW